MSWSLYSAISLGLRDALASRVAHSGLRMVVTVTILAISPWPCGRAYSVRGSRGFAHGCHGSHSHHLSLTVCCAFSARCPRGFAYGCHGSHSRHLSLAVCCAFSARSPRGFARCPTGLFMGNLENIGNHFCGLGNGFQPMGSAFYLFTLLRFYFSRPSFGVGQWWPAPWQP